ncbi:hypothetical protein V2J09_014860 [Rumex salicifolius]
MAVIPPPHFSLSLRPRPSISTFSTRTRKLRFLCCFAQQDKGSVSSVGVRIVFAAGGVGGHIYPAVAIADEVKAMNPNAKILFIGTESGIESKAVPAAGYEFASISDTASATVARPIFSLKNVYLPLHLIQSTIKSWRKLAEFDPQVVVGTGGYVSLPTCLAAVLRGIRLVIQEQCSVPGIANRILSVFAKSVFVAYDSIVDYFPVAEKRKCVVSGNPVRPLLKKPLAREAAIARYFPGLDPDPESGSDIKVLLVLGGSLGANAINIALERFYRDMLIEHPDWFIIWETGIDTYDEMESLIISHPRLILKPFLHNMHMAYTAADVVVSRAGAMTCSELLATGKPAILIPSPNEEEGRQFSNASLMVDLAGSRMIVEDELDSTTLRMVIEETMGSEYVRSVMSERAFQAAKPKAGAEIAEYILSLANSPAK